MPTIEFKNIRLPGDWPKVMAEERTKELSENIKEVGLINRPTIREDGTIGTGKHRIAALHMLGRDLIPYEAHTENSRDRLVVISENLFRGHLTPEEQRATFAEYVKLRAATLVKEQTDWGTDEGADAPLLVTPREAKSQAIAEAAGAANVSERTVRRALGEEKKAPQLPGGFQTWGVKLKGEEIEEINEAIRNHAAIESAIKTVQRLISEAKMFHDLGLVATVADLLRVVEKMHPAALCNRCKGQGCAECYDTGLRGNG